MIVVFPVDVFHLISSDDDLLVARKFQEWFFLHQSPGDEVPCTVLALTDYDASKVCKNAENLSSSFVDENTLICEWFCFHTKFSLESVILHWIHH